MPRTRLYVAKSGRLVPLGGGQVVIPPDPPAGGGTQPPPGQGGTGILFGASSHDGPSFDAAQATAGPWQVSRDYNAGALKTSWAVDASGPGIGKRASVWSAKPNMADLLDGKLDATITALISSIPDSQVVFAEIWHEADVKLRQGSLFGATGVSNLDDFNAAKLRFYTLVKSIAKPHVYTTLILSNWSTTGYTGSVGKPVSFWVGGDGPDRVIDVVGWDGYASGAATSTGAQEWETARLFADSHGAGWAIAELGLDEGVTSSAGATWLGNQLAYAQANGAGPHKTAAYVTLFNSTTGSVLATPGADPTLQAASRSLGVQYGTPWTSFVL